MEYTASTILGEKAILVLIVTYDFCYAIWLKFTLVMDVQFVIWKVINLTSQYSTLYTIAS